VKLVRETEQKDTQYDNIVFRYVLIGKLLIIISRKGKFKNNQADAAGFSGCVSGQGNLSSGVVVFGLRATAVQPEILRFA
jgi:hypothetical protein